MSFNVWNRTCCPMPWQTKTAVFRAGFGSLP